MKNVECEFCGKDCVCDKDPGPSLADLGYEDKDAGAFCYDGYEDIPLVGSEDIPLGGGVSIKYGGCHGRILTLWNRVKLFFRRSKPLCSHKCNCGKMFNEDIFNISISCLECNEETKFEFMVKKA